MLIGFLSVTLLQVGNFFLYRTLGWLWLYVILSLGLMVLLYLIIQFFRIPNRKAVFGALDI